MLIINRGPLHCASLEIKVLRMKKINTLRIKVQPLYRKKGIKKKHFWARRDIQFSFDLF